MPDDQATMQIVEAQNSASFPVDYLVIALRCKEGVTVPCDKCRYYINDVCTVTPEKMNGEAADVLEAQQGQLIDQNYFIELQKDTIDKLQTDVQRQHKHMLELAKQLPKRGEWRHGICKVCGFNWGAVAPIAGVPKYCPGCGSRNK